MELLLLIFQITFFLKDFKVLSQVIFRGKLFIHYLASPDLFLI